MRNKKFEVKKIDEFMKGFSREKKEKYYQKYLDYKFNEWLSQYSADKINEEGFEIYRKIFDVMVEEGDV